MDVEIPQDMIGMQHASDQLEAMIAADAAAKPTDAGSQATDQSASAAQRAGQTGKDNVQTPDKSSTDTPAGTDQSKVQSPESKVDGQDKGQQPDKTQQQPDPNAQPAKPESKFAKEQRRQKSAWEDINSQKEALKADRAKLDEERKALEAQRAESQREKFKPEDYEKAAEKFEEQGKFDLAEAARARAKKLRENPPAADPKAAQASEAQRAAFETQKKEWWAKTSIDFPGVAKEGTPENAALKQFIQAEPSVLQNPRAMYYAARMVAAETASARVPGMEKELGELRAKVKELEALTAPNPPSVPGRAPAGEVPFNQRSDAEQRAELEQLATAMGPLR